MYDRIVDQRELKFQVSGKLWNYSLIMIDVETGSQWSHLLGEAMAGELKGKKLATLPSLIIDWASWKEQHPETQVMVWENADGLKYTTDFYKSKPRHLFMVGLVFDDQAKCYPFPELVKTPVLNDSVGSENFVLYFQPDSGAAWCFSRSVQIDDNRELLEFAQQDGVIVDSRTNSQWDLRSGICKQGPLEGTTLKQQVVIPTMRRAWLAFHPDSVIHGSK